MEAQRICDASRTTGQDQSDEEFALHGNNIKMPGAMENSSYGLRRVIQADEQVSHSRFNSEMEPRAGVKGKT